MNVKYLIAFVIAGAAAVASVLFAVTTQQTYLTFDEARDDGGEVQVKGNWVKGSPAEYDPAENLFSFTMVDEDGTVMDIDYAGAKPNNFEMAEEVVVGGRFESGEFVATSLLTKCPSKYEADSIHVGDSYSTVYQGEETP